MLDVSTKISIADITAAENPIEAIINSAEYAQAGSLVHSNSFWSDAITSPYGAALIYNLIINYKLRDLAEIGSFRGKTSYLMAHALEANGAGHLHTVGPYDSHHFLPLYKKWPRELKARTTFHPVNSAEFFSSAIPADQRFDLVFVDGNHDYEYALFDIQCAAHRLRPGGFIVVDNIEQAGPASAVVQFLRDNPGYEDLSVSPLKDFPRIAYDKSRAPIPGTAFVVIRSPKNLSVSRRARTFGTIAWPRNVVSAVATSSQEEVTVQCVLRSFGPGALYEEMAIASGAGTVCFNPPLRVGENDTYTAEIWMSAEHDVTLDALPQPI